MSSTTGTYGFLWSFSLLCLFVLYSLWMNTSPELLLSLFDYLPSTYWGALLPLHFCCTLFYCMLVYWSMGLSRAAKRHEVCSLRDGACTGERRFMDARRATPVFADIPLGVVCEALYGDRGEQDKPGRCGTAER